MAVIVENPDGPVFLGVSPDNPYKHIPSEEDGGDTERVAFGTTVFLIPTRYVDFALQLEKHSYNVRIFSVLDFFMNLFNFIVTGYVASMLISFISLMGYYGALKYDRTRLVGYMFYQILMTIGRYAFLVNALVTHQYNEITYFVLPVMALVQTYITWYVIRFYKMLPNFGTRYTQVE